MNFPPFPYLIVKYSIRDFFLYSQDMSFVLLPGILLCLSLATLEYWDKFDSVSDFNVCVVVGFSHQQAILGHQLVILQFNSIVIPST